MIYLALGCLLLGLVLGFGGLKKVRRFAGNTWRPGAGVLSAMLLFTATVLAVKQQWAWALVCAAIGGFVALGARSQAGRAGPRPAPGRTGLSVEEAADLLGVAPDASPEEVAEAYRRLMNRVHPDKGGATGLAAQLNGARDVMNGRPGPPANRG